MAQTRRKIAEKRKHWLHHVSYSLAEHCGTVCIEDLHIQNLTNSAKGTTARPPRKVRAKSELNRAILSTGRGLRVRMRDDKAHREVPRHTSQACHRCAPVSAENRKTPARSEGLSCGYERKADVKAAFNRLAWGTGAAGPGGAFAPVRAGPSAVGLSSDPDDLSMDRPFTPGSKCI